MKTLHTHVRHYLHRNTNIIQYKKACVYVGVYVYGRYRQSRGRDLRNVFEEPLSRRQKRKNLYGECCDARSSLRRSDMFLETNPSIWSSAQRHDDIARGIAMAVLFHPPPVGMRISYFQTDGGVPYIFLSLSRPISRITARETALTLLAKVKATRSEELLGYAQPMYNTLTRWIENT